MKCHKTTQLDPIHEWSIYPHHWFYSSRGLLEAWDKLQGNCRLHGTRFCWRNCIGMETRSIIHSFLSRTRQELVLENASTCSMVPYEQLVLLLPTTFIHFHNCIATTGNKRYLFCMEGKPSTSSSQFTFRRRAKTTSGGATLPSHVVANCRLLEKTARRTYFSKWNPLISNPYIPWLSNCNWIELPNSNFRHTFVQYFRTAMQSVL